MGCDGYLTKVLEIKYKKGASLIEEVEYEISFERIYDYTNYYENYKSETKIIFSNNEFIDKKYEKKYKNIIDEYAPIIIKGNGTNEFPDIKAKVYQIVKKKYYQKR